MKKVRFTPAAEEDLRRIFEWFDSKRGGLGTEFLNRLDEVVSHISKYPEGGPVIAGDVRRFPILRQFTDYALWYRVGGDVIVIACLSSRRSPNIAQRRTSEIEP